MNDIQTPRHQLVNEGTAAMSFNGDQAEQQFAFGQTFNFSNINPSIFGQAGPANMIPVQEPRISLKKPREGPTPGAPGIIAASSTTGAQPAQTR